MNQTAVSVWTTLNEGADYQHKHTEEFLQREKSFSKVCWRFSVGGSVSEDVCLWIIDDKLIDFFLQCFSTSPIISHLRMCVYVCEIERAAQNVSMMQHTHNRQ